MQSFADNFGTIGKDLLGIGQALITIVKDLLTAWGGGNAGAGKAQYPFG